MFSSSPPYFNAGKPLATKRVPLYGKAQIASRSQWVCKMYNAEPAFSSAVLPATADNWCFPSSEQLLAAIRISAASPAGAQETPASPGAPATYEYETYGRHRSRRGNWSYDFRA